MTTKELVTELLNELKKAERLADHPQLIATVRELGDLEEQAVEAIPSLLSIFPRNYDVPALRDTLKTAFKQIGFDITRYEPFGKLRLPTRLLLLFALILLNGTLFGWGAGQYHPFNYLRISDTGPMLLEILSSEQVVMAKGNYYWVLATFLIAAIYCSLYLAYLLYLFRSFPSFPLTAFWTAFGLLAPLFGLSLGVFAVEQTLDSWVVFPSKTTFQQLLVVGFLSSLWTLFVNVQFNSFVNGFIREAFAHYPQIKINSSTSQKDF